MLIPLTVLGCKKVVEGHPGRTTLFLDCILREFLDRATQTSTLGIVAKRSFHICIRHALTLEPRLERWHGRGVHRGMCRAFRFGRSGGSGWSGMVLVRRSEGRGDRGEDVVSCVGFEDGDLRFEVGEGEVDHLD